MWLCIKREKDQLLDWKRLEMQLFQCKLKQTWDKKMRKIQYGHKVMSRYIDRYLITQIDPLYTALKNIFCNKRQRVKDRVSNFLLYSLYHTAQENDSNISARRKIPMSKFNKHIECCATGKWNTSTHTHTQCNSAFLNIHPVLWHWSLWFWCQDTEILLLPLYFSVRRTDSHLLQKPVKQCTHWLSSSPVSSTGEHQTVHILKMDRWNGNIL